MTNKTSFDKSIICIRTRISRNCVVTKVLTPTQIIIFGHAQLF